MPKTNLITKEAQALFGVLNKLSGKVEGPADWSTEHDHYLYGTPKHKNP